MFVVTATSLESSAPEVLVTDSHPSDTKAIAQAMHIWNLDDSTDANKIRFALLDDGEYEDHTVRLEVKTTDIITAWDLRLGDEVHTSRGCGRVTMIDHVRRHRHSAAEGVPFGVRVRAVGKEYDLQPEWPVVVTVPRPTKEV